MDKKNGKSGFIGVIIIIIVIVALIGSCGGGTSSKYDDDLNSGLKKYQNGEKMNKDEYNAVKNFNNWREKQRDKTYDEWDN